MKGDQFSPEKMRELLNEMEKLGRKGGGGSPWSGDIGEGMEALEQGQSDKAMEAMERALNKLRSMEDQGREGKGLKGGRENERRGGQRGGARGPEPGGRATRATSPRARGSFPGGARAAAPRAIPPSGCAPTRSTWASRGSRGPARRRAWTPTSWARGANTPSRLQYLGVVGPVPQDDGRGHRPRAGAARLPGARSSSTSSRWTRSSAVATATRGQDLLVAGLPGAARAARPAVAARVPRPGQGRAPQPPQGHQRGVLRLPPVRDRRRPPLRGLEHLRAARSPLREALRGRGGSLPATSSSTPPPPWPSARPASSPTARGWRRRSGFVGLVNLERVGVGVVRERLAEGWSPTRGRGQVLPLLDFLAPRPAGRRHLAERGPRRLAPAHPRGRARRPHLGPHGSGRLRARAQGAARAPPRRARDPPPRPRRR